MKVPGEQCQACDLRFRSRLRCEADPGRAVKVAPAICDSQFSIAATPALFLDLLRQLFSPFSRTLLLESLGLILFLCENSVTLVVRGECSLLYR